MSVDKRDRGLGEPGTGRGVSLERVQLMRNLIVLGFVGLLAQLIDGSLGMAYGVTSSTLLLAAGIAPAAASAAVHFSEIGTTLVSGISHHRLGNVDWRTVSIIAVPGGVGAPSTSRQAS